MAEETTLERRYRERIEKEKKKRADKGTEAMSSTAGRSAEYYSEKRTDYTLPKLPKEHGVKIEIGKAAEHSSSQIGPKEGIIKPLAPKKKKKNGEL